MADKGVIESIKDWMYANRGDSKGNMPVGRGGAERERRLREIEDEALGRKRAGQSTDKQNGY